MKSRLKRVPITPTELKDNYDSWGFSPAVLSGDLLFIGGQVGICLDGSVPTDPSKQMEQTFLNMESVLKAAGGTFDDVVDLTVFYTNYEAHGSLVRPIRDKFFGVDATPNWTAIGIAALAAPFVFEVKAIARLTD